MSTLAVDTLTPANPGSQTYFLARAWVNFNGTGTVAIRQSGNVSSITDNGVGNYTINTTNALSVAAYAAGISYTSEVNVQHTIGFNNGGQTTTTLQCVFFNAANSANTADKSVVGITMTQ